MLFKLLSRMIPAALVLLATSACNAPVNASKTANVFVGDPRVQVTNTQAPWSAIGKLVNTNDGSWCTAQLIARNFIITAAHCVVEDDGSGLSDATHYKGNYEFYPMYGEAGTHPSSHVSRFWWGTSSPITYRNDDFAVGKLDDNLGDTVGWFGWECDSSQQLFQARTYYLGGYSGDIGNGDVASWQQGCQFTKDTGSGTVLHNCSTSRGSSGSAMFYYQDPSNPTTTSKIVALNVAEFRDGGDSSLIGIPYDDAHANIAVPLANACPTIQTALSN